MSTEHYMLPYLDQVVEDSQRREQYGTRQRENVILRLLGQMAIPIEAAMDEEADEELAA